MILLGKHYLSSLAAIDVKKVALVSCCYYEWACWEFSWSNLGFYHSWRRLERCSKVVSCHNGGQIDYHNRHQKSRTRQESQSLHSWQIDFWWLVSSHIGIQVIPFLPQFCHERYVNFARVCTRFSDLAPISNLIWAVDPGAEGRKAHDCKNFSKCLSIWTGRCRCFVKRNHDHAFFRYCLTGACIVLVVNNLATPLR